MPNDLHRPRQSWPRALGALAAAALALFLMVAPAWGQGRAELQSALSQAMRSYDELEFSEAERRLEDAIQLAERLGLDQDLATADLHIFLGVVRFTVSGEEATERSFRAGLTINPDANISPDYKTPDLDVILERVRASIPRKNNNPTPNPTPVGGREIEHVPVQTANAGQPIIFEASVPPSVPLYRMQLNYRRYGEREYSILDMPPVNPTTFRVILPGDEVYTSNIDYFIEVLDRTGGILVATGGPLSPLNTIVFGGDKFKGNPKGKTPDPTPRDDGERQYVFLQVSGGGGFGLATATPDVMKQLEINPGIAPAPFHVLGELGLMLTPSLHLSGFYRAQIVEQENLFGGKLKWWFDSDSDWQAYTGVGGGYGRVRHTVDLRPAAEFVDTTREGPFHGGVGFGFGYKIGANVMFVIDFYTLILFPDISAHLDGQLGFRFSL